MPKISKVRFHVNKLAAAAASRKDTNITTNCIQTQQEPSDTPDVVMDDGTNKRRVDVASGSPTVKKRRSDLGVKRNGGSSTSDVVMDDGTNERRVDVASPTVKKRRSDLGVKRNGGASQAAMKYGSKYTSELRFLRCGSCLREDSSSKFIELSKVKEAGIINYLRKMKPYNLMQLRLPNATVYDKIFSNAYQDFVDDDGIFRSSRFICLDCYKDLRKVNRFFFCKLKIIFNCASYILF